MYGLRIPNLRHGLLIYFRELELLNKMPFTATVVWLLQIAMMPNPGLDYSVKLR
jgi:hypothetical protein